MFNSVALPTNLLLSDFPNTTFTFQSRRPLPQSFDVSFVTVQGVITDLSVASPVPEPSALGLIGGLGLLGLGAMKRRSRSAPSNYNRSSPR